MSIVPHPIKWNLINPVPFWLHLGGFLWCSLPWIDQKNMHYLAPIRLKWKKEGEATAEMEKGR